MPYSIFNDENSVMISIEIYTEIDSIFLFKVKCNIYEHVQFQSIFLATDFYEAK